LPPKSGIIVCPNPKCHRDIEEPILLNNLSKSPVEQYQACPYCFVKLDTDAENEEDVMEESRLGSPLPPSLEKSRDSGSVRLQKRGDEAPVKPSKVEEKGPKGCPHYFGYLTHRPKDASIPQECLTCPKIVECMLKL